MCVCVSVSVSVCVSVSVSVCVCLCLCFCFVVCCDLIELGANSPFCTTLTNAATAQQSKT